MNWQDHYQSKICTPDDAVKSIKSGDYVVVSHACGEPRSLTKAMSERYAELRDVKVVHRVGMGECLYAQPGMEEHFRHISLFGGINTRKAIYEGRADYIPRFISETPALFLEGHIPVDVALITVSPPDKYGYCSLGISVDYSLPAARMAKTVIAEVNVNMPRTLGDSFMSVKDIAHFVLSDAPLMEVEPATQTNVEVQIGNYCADLIENGSTLQMGIGAIPDAVLAAMVNKKDLGIHTEMFSDGLVPLVEMGVINGSKKTIHPYKIISTFMMGTKALYKWLDDNPLVEMHPENYVNDPWVIAQNYKVVSINSALQIDVLGQVAADTIGPKQFSGVGGQIDFIRGAKRSVGGGKSIIAVPSTASGGKVSRIVPSLYEGTAVTTTRNEVDFVITEFGVAQLSGKTNLERLKALVGISHPDFRDEIMFNAKKLYYGA
ncbi:MAG TPA: acetyl-CoA hydrolase/transferase C-terminal domain-containing protein [Syntrophomonadaceae bacterium]|nr:acetyl-CoA hydrolase/transferase C-terminal domain-containing protein [Syntrophomonadaceae bacterium]HRX22053.1 acetyl-CoA hydrolase/transferase C-terminal domain-containing protein [Syntrophomonadaceae bacterium]